MNNPKPVAIVVFDIDGVLRDVSGSYRRAIADTVEHFTNNAYRPSATDIDALKSEGIWNNDWEATQELVYRYFERQGKHRQQLALDYNAIIDFFQSLYLGSDRQNWTGYICQEPLLLQPSYLENLLASRIYWGFFSGAPRAEAAYLLEKRLGINSPLLVAMEDAPGKPDPTGLLAVVTKLEQQYEIDISTPVVYVGDTVADIYTVNKARTLPNSKRSWIAVGILPPHIQEIQVRCEAYTNTLKNAGADVILSNVEQLDLEQIQKLLNGV